MKHWQSHRQLSVFRTDAIVSVVVSVFVSVHCEIGYILCWWAGFLETKGWLATNGVGAKFSAIEDCGWRPSIAGPGKARNRKNMGSDTAKNGSLNTAKNSQKTWNRVYKVSDSVYTNDHAHLKENWRLLPCIQRVIPANSAPFLALRGIGQWAFLSSVLPRGTTPGEDDSALSLVLSVYTKTGFCIHPVYKPRRRKVRTEWLRLW